MNEKNVQVIVKYILFNGEQIEIEKIDKLRHQFPLDLIGGERKNRAIVSVIERASPNSSVILEIHEGGTLKDNLV